MSSHNSSQLDLGCLHIEDHGQGSLIPNQPQPAHAAAADTSAGNGTGTHHCQTQTSVHSDPSGSGTTLSTAPAPSQPPSLSSGSSSPLSPEEAHELSTIMGRIESMSQTVQGPPWLQCPHAQEWDTQSALQWLQANIRHQAVLREMVLFVQTVMSGEPGDISFLYFLYYVWVSGGLQQLGDGDGGAQTYRIKGGAQQISLRLADEVQALGGRVMLSTPVHRVTQPAAGCAPVGCQHPQGTPVQQQLGDSSLRQETSRQHQHPQSVVVECQGGTFITADHVVIAMPPPVWSATLAFEPPLPPAQQALGEHMFMGCAVKCVALYNRAFWRELKPVEGGWVGGWISGHRAEQRLVVLASVEVACAAIARVC